jgi:predicted dehydrogenase
MGKLNWGIIGLGNIAHQFVKDILLFEDAVLYGVASRNKQKAKDFADQYNAFCFYGDYDSILNDPNIDIIYIATPHNLHCELTIKALKLGKHVLCEKPIALNFLEASQMIAASKQYQKFFMEAFWTRFNPSFEQILQKINYNEIGKIRYINADFAFAVSNLDHRMTDLILGGGSLMDMGVYPVFLSYMILGIPHEIVAITNKHDTGTDNQTSIILGYPKAHAVLHSSFVSPSNMIATISGTEGRINLDTIWHEAQGYSVVKNNHNVSVSLPTIGKGFYYEIAECHNCIANNQIESSKWSHQNSLDLIEIIDSIRKKIDLKFPSEL